MESNHQEEESIYSNDQEIDQSAQENSFGLGRSYECVFCRRGFNTAQALGGHMNIHRKDRAPRNKPIPNPTSINTRKLHIEEINYTGGSRFYHQIPNTSCSSHLVAPHHAPGIDDVQIDYTAYNFPASTSTAGRTFYANHDSIYLPFGPGIVEEIAKSRRGGIQEEELDLELRL